MMSSQTLFALNSHQTFCVISTMMDENVSSFSCDLRTVPNIVTVHTFCPSCDTQFSMVGGY